MATVADHTLITAATFLGALAAILIPVALRRTDERNCRFANTTDNEDES